MPSTHDAGRHGRTQRTVPRAALAAPTDGPWSCDLAHVPFSWSGIADSGSTATTDASAVVRGAVGLLVQRAGS
jgi:hypothetical protein